MKLRIKIFISILFVSLTTLIIISYSLIQRNHLGNIQREKERSLNEYTFLINTLDNGINAQSTKEELKPLFQRYVEYYESRDINLMIYDGMSPYVVNFQAFLESPNPSLLSVQEGTRTIQIIELMNKHYFVVSGKLTNVNDFTILYARDIDNIYHQRIQSIYLSLLIATILIILQGLLSYLYSRWITRPIEGLNQLQ